jgi:hypothetical protein
LTELKETGHRRCQDAEFEGGEELTDDTLARLRSDNASLEQLEQSLMSRISSLKNDEVNLQKELNDATSGSAGTSKERKAAEMEKVTAEATAGLDDDDDEPKVKKEYEPKIQVKVKHWHPQVTIMSER